MKRVFQITVVSIICALGFQFNACDKVDNPYPDIGIIDTNIVWDDSIEATPNNGVRFILMEE